MTADSPHNGFDDKCGCQDCENVRVTARIVGYMMFWMPRSDRALWHEPAPRLTVPDRS